MRGLWGLDAIQVVTGVSAMRSHCQNGGENQLKKKKKIDSKKVGRKKEQKKAEQLENV